MRAAQYDEEGGPEVLHVRDLETPTPGKSEILVEVRAASVNPIDTYLRKGHPIPLDFPVCPGLDYAGVVESVGADVDEFEPGDHVFGLAWDCTAEYVAAPASSAAHLPEEVSFEEGAAVGLVGLTAMRAIFDYGDLDPGQTCLIHGGSGGVGSLGVQLADIAGSNVISSSKSEERREQIREFGADAVFDYRRDDLPEAVLDAADGGVDVIIDGHLDTYYALDFEVIAESGTIVALEFTHSDGVMEFTQSDLRKGLATDAKLQFIGAVSSRGSDAGRIMKQLGDLLKRDKVSIDIADTFDLEDIEAAHRKVGGSDFMGKVIITP